MDEASRIIADLQHKLCELDFKVVQYRHEMYSEFEKYAENVLRNVKQDVSSEVTKAIAASLMNYSALHPEQATTSNQTTPPTTTITTTTSTNKEDERLGLQVIQITSNQDEPPRSPHAREREFTGLFTPSYLPLLDSTDRHERSSSEDMIKLHHPLLEPEKSDGPNSSSDPANPAKTTLLLERPSPLRKNTDTSVVSTSSDSDSTLRKSALRRSSSSASHNNLLSPRKVRFALEGQEYPTDSSPNPPTIAEEPQKRETILLGFYDNDSDDEAGSEQIENIEEEEEEPPPKRISSSQALRALSRGPLEDDDGVQWTVVAAPPDGSAPIPIEDEKNAGRAYIDANDDAEENLEIGAAKAQRENKDAKISKQASVNQSSQHSPMVKKEAPRSPTATSIAIAPNEPVKTNGTSKSQVVSRSLPTSAVKIGLTRMKSTFSLGDSDSESDSEMEQGTRGEKDEDEDLFEFEDGAETHMEKENNSKRATSESDISNFSPSDLISPRMASSYRQDHRQDNRIPSLRADFRSESLGNHAAITSSSHGGGSSYRHAKKSSEGSQTVGTPSGVDYSYKGSRGKIHPHPFTQPIVSQRAQREAEEMGDLQSWVGSLDGRSGVDDRHGDSGFRSSLGLGAGMAGSWREGGQPRSLSERLMMDEEMEENARKGR